MVNVIAIAATVAAALLGVAAFVALSIDRFVLSGTLFVLTAFAIYVRETKG
ncbi:MAG: hypothetical protein V5A55_12890 [Halovenus sp.]